MGIISNYLPISSDQSVAILDEDGNQLFIDKSGSSLLQGAVTQTALSAFGIGNNQAEIISADVIDDSRAFQHPLDDNDVITDHKINLPIQINVQMVISKDSQSVIFNEVNLYKIKGYTCSVKLKARQYDNMVLLTSNHRESIDHFNAIMLTLRFQEERPESSIPGPTPSSADQSNTKTLGRRLLEFIV